MRKKFQSILLSLMILLTLVSIQLPIQAQNAFEIGTDEVVAIKRNEQLVFTLTHNGAALTPADITVWENSNSKVASISGFTITALSYGTTVLIGNIESDTGNQYIRIEVNVLDGIAFERNNITIDVEESTTVKVVTNPQASIANLQLTYTSLDESVVSVSSSGQVTGLKEGETIVEARYFGFVASLPVTVKNVPDFKFDQSRLTMNLYSSTMAPYTISIHGGRDDTIRWSSDNEAIVTVDQNGWITAVGTGEARITAKVLNQDYLLPVVVQSGVVDFKVSHSSVTLEQNQSFQLEWTIEPASHSQLGVTWVSSKPSVASVSNGLITAHGPGSAIIYGRVGDIVREIEVNVNISVDNISVLPSRLELSQNEEASLAVIYKPSNTTASKNPQFSSADPEIASVDSNGIVRGISPGQTTIFVEDLGFSLTVPVTVTYQSDNSGNTILIGEFRDADTVTFDLGGLQSYENSILEVPFYEPFSSLDEITLNLIINDELLDGSVLLARGLFLNRQYQGKTIYLNVYNEQSILLYAIDFNDFDLPNSNLFVNVYKDIEGVSKKRASDVLVRIPLVLSGNTTLRVNHDSEGEVERLYMYLVEDNLSLSQLEDDYQVVVDENGFYQFPSVSNGLYLISSLNNDMILSDFLIYSVSGLAVVAILGFVLYKVREMRKQEKLEQNEKFGIE